MLLRESIGLMMQVEIEEGDLLRMCLNFGSGDLTLIEEADLLTLCSDFGSGDLTTLIDHAEADL